MGIPYLPDGLSDDWKPGFARVVDAVHAEGAPIFVQLAHIGAPGMPATWTLDGWSPLWAPSSLRSPNQWAIPKAIEADDIAELVDGFARTAANVQDTGADGIEIHAAHGYLLSTFLSPLWNQRADEYGGSTENRSRIVREVGEAVRRRCGDNFVIGLKINFNEYHGDIGINNDEACRVIEVLNPAGIFQFYSIAHGDYHSIHRVIPPMSSGDHATMVKAAARAKQIANGVPVLVQGMIQTIELAETLVEQDTVDMVGLVRPQIADPEIVNKTREGRVQEIRRCVGQNQGCVRRIAIGVSCTVNPLAGREWSLAERIKPVDTGALRVLVVGGGPAGMKFAETAALKGHQATLMEREAVLGGQVNFAAKLPDYDSWRNLVEDLGSQLKRLAVDVRLGAEATLESIIELQADKVVIATGSTWDKDGFSGYFNPEDPSPPELHTQVLDPIEVLRRPSACGHHVLIIDDIGDYTPLGIARILRSNGHHVSIVTGNYAVGHKMHITNEFDWLYPRVLKAGVEIHTMTVVQLANEEVAMLRNIATNEVSELRTDTIIPCMGRKPIDSLYFELKCKDFEVSRIGDCLAPREVDDAVLEGFREAIKLVA
jgi:2,4-dienoyl-CoA reductase-like NADH-dependent reductase (Old Yellow Enzyme family)